MKALLLLAALSASANTRGRVAPIRSNTAAVAPVPVLPIVALNATSFGASVNPTLRVDAPASIPVLTPLRQLAAADAPAPHIRPITAAAPAAVPAAAAALAAQAAADATASDAIAPLQDPGPAAPGRGILGLLRWMAAPPVVPQRFDMEETAYYHGTSFDTLERIVDSGGVMKPSTFLSEQGGFSYSYARSKARGSRTPGVVLQFPRASLQDRLDVDRLAFEPGPGESTKGIPMFMKTREGLPLAEMTTASKASLIAWVRAQRDSRPGDAAWAARADKLAAALAVPADAPVLKTTPATGLGLEGLALKGGNRWLKNGAPLQRLGKGSIGFVDAHPTRDDAVVKTIAPIFDQIFMGLDYATAVKADEAAAAVLAGAGVGPRVFGSAVIEKRHVSVRERVYGDTMRALIDRRAFGEAEEALVREMVARMAAAGVLVSDIKPENIMIGETRRVPGRRAWFIDGGIVESLDLSLDQAGREAAIMDYPNVIAVRMDKSSGKLVESYRTLNGYIRGGRLDSTPMSAWRRFLRFLVKVYLEAPPTITDK